MRVAIIAILVILLHIIGVPWWKSVAAVVCVIMFWNLPGVLGKSISRRW